MYLFTIFLNRPSFRLLAFTALCAIPILGLAQTILRSAVDPSFAPHAMAKLGGGIQGFNVDLGEELGKRLGRKVEIDGAEFSGLIPGLNSRRYDFLLAPVTVTPARSKLLLFTEGYLDTDFTFLSTKSTPALAKPEDLKGKTIAVNKGSNYEAWARDNAAKYGFKYDVYGSNADAVQALQSGRAEFNLAGNTAVAWIAKQNPNLHTGYTIKTGQVFAIPFRLDDKVGRDLVSNALKCMKKDGSVAKLAVKWFGYTPSPEDSAVKIAPGTGVLGTEGYDSTPVTPKCN
jgi:ABC-type amino acid transport substrate-binding protein